MFSNQQISWIIHVTARPLCWVKPTSPCEPSMSNKLGLTSWTTIMMAYVFTKYGLLIFDTTVAVITLNYAGQPVNHARNVVIITKADRFSNDGESTPGSIIQPATPTRVAALITFVTLKSVRDKYPTTTPKLYRNPSCVNLKTINYITK